MHELILDGVRSGKSRAAETRHCVDALGEPQLGVAARCARVTLMVAGRELPLPPPTGAAP